MEKTINRVKILPDVNLPLVSDEVMQQLKKSTQKVDKVLSTLKRAFTVKK
jgi:hypothetical protein